MQVIDAHIHTKFDDKDIVDFAKKINIDCSLNGLQKELRKNNVKAAIIITSETHAPTPGEYERLIKQSKEDKRLFPICSINPEYVGKKELQLTKTLLEKKQIYGLKIFPGYHPIYSSNKKYFPFYKLAAEYNIPVVIHTGDTFGQKYFLKYAHPLDIDEVAVRFPKTNFIIAHLGNPWIRDTAEVIYKNENVYGDLSAFCIGLYKKFPTRVVEDIKFTFDYTGNPEKFLYGSDWPLVSMKYNIKLIKKTVPRSWRKQVFFENANKLFKLGL